MSKDNRVISPVLEWLGQNGLTRPFNAPAASKVKTIDIQIPSNVSGQPLYMPFDPQLDDAMIRAIQIPDQTELQWIIPEGSNTAVEALTEAQIAEFVIVFAKKDEVLITIPATNAILQANSGKICFLELAPDEKRIADSYILQTGSSSLSGKVLRINVWYD